MKRLFLLLLAAWLLPTNGAFAQRRVNIVHAGFGAPPVDVYANGILALPGIGYLQASGIVEVDPLLSGNDSLIVAVVPAGQPIANAVLTDTIIFTQPQQDFYAVVAGSAIFAPELPPLGLFVKETDFSAPSGESNFEILHAATVGFPVQASINGTVAIQSLDFGEYAPQPATLTAGNVAIELAPVDLPNRKVFKYSTNVQEGLSGLLFAANPSPTRPLPLGLYLVTNDIVTPLPGVNEQKIQVIHSSFNAPAVDIFVNGSSTPAVTGLAFRQATDFISVGSLANSNSQITVDVAPAGAGIGASVLSKTIDFAFHTEEAYVVAAGPLDGLDLYYNTSGSYFTATTNAAILDLFHGVSDAPTVDVYACGDIAYSALGQYEFSIGAIEVPAGKYDIDLTAAGQRTPIYSVSATVTGTTKGLVVASGVLNPAPGEPAFGLFLVPPTAGNFIPLDTLVRSGQRVQIVHASPDAPGVDVFINDNPVAAITNLKYKEATGVIDIGALNLVRCGRVKVSIAPAGAGIGQAVYNQTLEFSSDNANAIVVAAGKLAGGTNPFGLFVTEGANFGPVTGGAKIIAFHGSPDAPTVDVRSGGSAVISGLAFGNFKPAGYLTLPAGSYELEIAPAGSTNAVACFNAAVTDQTVGMVLAHGLLSGTPSFGLSLVTPSGTVVDLSACSPAVNIRAYHNSPDAPAVDIFIDDNPEPAITNLAFRQSSALLDYRGTNVNVKIAPAGAGIGAAVFNKTWDVSGLTGVYLVAAGELSGANKPFDVYAYTNAKFSVPGANALIQVFHGSPDAPTVDISANGNVVVPGLAFGQFAPNYLELPPATYTVGVAPQGGQVLANYAAPISVPTAALVLASGYLNPVNQNDPEFGLFASFSEGNWIPLPVQTDRSTSALAAAVSVFPNPATEWVYIVTTNPKASDAVFTLTDLAGRTITTQSVSLSEGMFAIDVANVTPGIYTYRISAGNYANFGRIVVK